MRETYTEKGKLLVCGNTGSASDSEHIVGELMKGFILPRKIKEENKKRICEVAGEDSENICNSLQTALPAISLVSQTSFMTAYSNDKEPDMIFANEFLDMVLKEIPW